MADTISPSIMLSSMVVVWRVDPHNQNETVGRQPLADKPPVTRIGDHRLLDEGCGPKEDGSTRVERLSEVPTPLCVSEQRFPDPLAKIEHSEVCQYVYKSLVDAGEVSNTHASHIGLVSQYEGTARLPAPMNLK